MATRSKRAGKSIYQLKITLADISPPIWRRIQVPGGAKLPDLNLMIQAAMGWYNCHLHKFTINGVEYSESDPDWDDLDYEDERRVRLEQVVPCAGISFSYMYDFGDGWEHDVLVEEIVAPAKGVKYPICPDGGRACPPEDVGGPWGYAEFLEAMRNPAHEQYAEFREWIGGDFDPEAFDLKSTSATVKNYKMLDAHGV